MRGLHSSRPAFGDVSYPSQLLLGLLSLTSRVLGLLPTLDASPSEHPDIDHSDSDHCAPDHSGLDENREDADSFAAFLLGIIAFHIRVEHEFLPESKPAEWRSQSAAQPQSGLARPNLRRLLR